MTTGNDLFHESGGKRIRKLRDCLVHVVFIVDHLFQIFNTLSPQRVYIYFD